MTVVTIWRWDLIPHFARRDFRNYTWAEGRGEGEEDPRPGPEGGPWSVMGVSSRMVT